jgi:class 3 adenylate cyclase
MPIYLDVHRNLKAQPDDVAMAHSMDLQVQSKYNVRYTRYWHNQETGCVYCLVEAPSIADAVRVHKEAHGLVADQLIEVTMDQVEAFLGAQKPTHSGTDPKDGGFRVVMFTDIADSTTLSCQLGDQRFHDILKTHDAMTREALKSHSGTEIKHTGDGILASFRSVSKGVKCAVEIQRTLGARKLDSDTQPIKVRVGLSAGEPVADHKDLFGTTVNLAARVCAFAQPGQILISNAIRELCLGQPFVFSEIGEVKLKGFAQPLHLHEVRWMSDDDEEMIENVSVSPEAKPEAVEDELSDADLESVAAASLIDCPTRQQLPQ